MNIKRAEYAKDPRPADESCDCYCCRRFSRAYLRHLYQAGEILASCLLTLHNLRFYHRLMEKLRQAIREDSFDGWRQDSSVMLKDINSGQEES
jgi:queuine tRNA-ribosyltransferase